MRRLRIIHLCAALAWLLTGCLAGADEESHEGSEPVQQVSRASSTAPESDDGHGQHKHGLGEEASAEPEGLASAWSALESARDAVAADVGAETLQTIHGKVEPVPQLAETLLEYSADLDAAKRARVESAIRQLPNVAGALHEAADAGDLERTRRELKRLDGLLQLIRAQYPEEALAAPPGAPTGDPHSRHADGHGDVANAEGSAAGSSPHSHALASAHVGEPSQETVRLVADDFRFEPREISLRAGVPTQIELHNEGVVEHAFVVRVPDGSTDAIHLHVAPGATDAAIVRLDQPGRYAALCTIPGHTEAGMVGEITVVVR
ncbi:MAG: cupredoxin domain-containing protein [Myxococcota bacterium]